MHRRLLVLNIGVAGRISFKKQKKAYQQNYQNLCWISYTLKTSLPNLLHSLLHNPIVLVLSPSVIVKKKRENLLSSRKDHPETYRLTVSVTSSVKRSYIGFRHWGLCSDSVAVAEKKGILQIHIRKFKNSRSRAAITYPIKPDGAGWKRGQKRGERTYPSCTVKSGNQWQHPFTETWRNNEPFMIAILKDILDAPIVKGIFS